jgi:hypothetical protein
MQTVYQAVSFYVGFLVLQIIFWDVHVEEKLSVFFHGFDETPSFLESKSCQS